VTTLALEAALAAAGIDARVEPRGKFALLTARDARALRQPAARAAAIRIVTAHGFVQVALELTDPVDSAPLPGT
jgi:hypothetical protein